MADVKAVRNVVKGAEIADKLDLMVRSFGELSNVAGDFRKRGVTTHTVSAYLRVARSISNSISCISESVLEEWSAQNGCDNAREVSKGRDSSSEPKG